jgi:hypothetical protein
MAQGYEKRCEGTVDPVAHGNSEGDVDGVGGDDHPPAETAPVFMKMMGRTGPTCKPAPKAWP